MADKNAEIIKDAYCRWCEGDPNAIDHWLNLLADNIQWKSLANGAPGMEFSRECQSRDDVARYFADLLDNWEMLRFETNEFIAQNDRVVMLGSCAWKHKRNGKKVDTPKADFIRLKDGKIVEFFEFYDTAQAIDAANSSV